MDKKYWNGAEAAHRRVMMKAAGYEDSDLREKPIIGVPDAFMEGSPGFVHLREIAAAIKEGIWAAGGVPVEFGIPATCGNIANGADELKYEQVGRDIVCMSIEFVTKVHHFDGLIMAASCDNIIAGCYLSAMRLNIPSLVVTGGPMQAGCYQGKTVVESDLDSARFSGTSEKKLKELEDCVCPGAGACPSMGTANTMQMLGEVLNLVMPGTSTIPATDAEKLRQAREAGKMIVELVKQDRKPTDFIDRNVLENAIMFDLAAAGSTNAVLHLLAYAYELGIPMSLKDFDKYAEEIPCINAVIPSGPHSVVDFHNAGGVLKLMKEIEGSLHSDALSLLGCSWKELLKNINPEPNEVIHAVEDPVLHEPGLKILYGNLSPNGAIVRPTAVYDEVKHMKGPAKVFDSDQEAFHAIISDRVHPGDILVIRYEGCKGAPGMKELMLSIDALIGKGLHKSVGIISDARFSGFNYGAIVGHVSPEAYDGGTIALVRDGDMIDMDIRGGRLDLLVPEEELRKRRESWVQPPLKEGKGCLNLYARTCRPAEEGGAMQPWGRDGKYSTECSTDKR
ncbi:MAG: dihydroxy-acid dehydratase [Clostridiales bacterium]|jgi:dihydroxy-acid dehydratase|nr:dihydroxy-acid dehydratase [Clostridiales bacterium]